MNLARALADASTDAVVPAGRRRRRGPLVGPYLISALGASASYNATTTTITTTVTGAQANKTYDFTYTSVQVPGQTQKFTCVSPTGSGSNVSLQHSYQLPSGFASGQWNIVIDEFNAGQGCGGSSNRQATIGAIATVTAPGTISGVVFQDANGNQTADSGEGLSGASLSLFRDSNTNGVYDQGTDLQVGATQTSSAQEQFSFGSLGVSTTYFVEACEPRPAIRRSVRWLAPTRGAPPRRSSRVTR